MNTSEFDKYADAYRSTHAKNIKISGEEPEYFSEYKIAEVAKQSQEHHMALDVNILDFGCGVGSSYPFFRKYFPHAQLTGLDVSEKSLSIAKERFGDGSWIHFDGNRFPFDDGTFDIAFVACVFHHIPPDLHIQVLLELRRVLRKGGMLFIFEHNPWNPLTLHAVNTCEFDENAILLSSRELRTKLLAANFGDLTLRFHVFIPGQLKSIRRLEHYLYWCPAGAQYSISCCAP